MGANCLALVRSRVRMIGTHSPMGAGRKFAPRFALLVRTLLREAGANPVSGYHAGYHGKLPMQWLPAAGFHYGFHGFAVVSNGKLANRLTAQPHFGNATYRAW